MDHSDTTLIGLDIDKYIKYEMCLSKIIVTCIMQHQVIVEAQFMKKLSNTEGELRKSLTYKKACILKLE